MAIIECVPNFSEGTDREKINEIAAAIDKIEKVSVLHIDRGISANRTVITFAGEPEAVVEAAFRGVKKASELIDMTQHRGTHPRIGATDVCPLVPVSEISMKEVVELSRKLGKRIGEELHIPVYLYEQAASRPERRNLATIRKGGFEQLADKLSRAEWTPDYGKMPYRLKAGATVVGTRDFLLAYNVNLDTRNEEIAKEIASEIRFSGKLVFDPISNKTIRKSGLLPFVKAIGWYQKEFGLSQVSMNLTNMEVTPVFTAFEKVRELAGERGVRVKGSELVGLIPLKYILEAGAYFLKKEGKTPHHHEGDDMLINAAVQGLGLSQLKPFYPKKRILEYAIQAGGLKI